MLPDITKSCHFALQKEEDEQSSENTQMPFYEFCFKIEDI
jgi:hypothetical protein